MSNSGTSTLTAVLMRTRSHRVSSGPKKNLSSRPNAALIIFDNTGRLRSVVRARLRGLISRKNIAVAQEDRPTHDPGGIETIGSDEVLHVLAHRVVVGVEIVVALGFVMK